MANPNKYPQEVVDKAQKLWEGGMKAPEIAQALGIPRRETIFNWRKKYGWSRPNEEDAADILKSTALQLKKYWLEALEYTIECLKVTDFKSAEGAISALESATDALSKLDAVLKADEFTATKPADNVRSILGLQQNH